MKIMTGNAHVYLDHVNTDVIIPTPYLRPDKKEMGAYCFNGHDPEFASRVRQGDMIVAGVNFGCGSTKPAADALLGAGITCVIAKSFGRVFFRNALNAGLLVIACPELEAQTGDLLAVDFDHNQIENLTRHEKVTFEPYDPFIGEIIQAGGIINLLKAQRKE